MSTIKNASNTANITTTQSSYVGGIVGELKGTGTYDITKLENQGAVVGVDNVGGVIGAIVSSSWDSNTIKINDLTNKGSVTGVNKVAGCVGLLDAYATRYSSSTTTVTAVQWTNTATVSGAEYVAGLIGYANTDNGASSLTDYTTAGEVTATGSNVADTVAYCANFKVNEPIVAES